MTGGMQREERMTGSLAACRCGKQPKHYVTLGKDLHHLECPPCGLRTAKLPTLQEAVECWEAQGTEQFDVRQRA